MSGSGRTNRRSDAGSCTNIADAPQRLGPAPRRAECSPRIVIRIVGVGSPDVGGALQFSTDNSIGRTAVNPTHYCPNSTITQRFPRGDRTAIELVLAPGDDPHPEPRERPSFGHGLGPSECAATLDFPGPGLQDPKPLLSCWLPQSAELTGVTPVSGGAARCGVATMPSGEADNQPNRRSAHRVHDRAPPP